MIEKNLLESIRCLDGEVFHLQYHQERFDASRKALGFTDPLTLEIIPPPKGLFRCRVVYAKTIKKIEYIPYTPKKIRSFKCVHSQLDYSLKYEDRTALNQLLSSEADEIIIIKDGFVTDCSIANLCFFDGKEWLTPAKPLLKGSTRARLLQEQRIKTRDIHYKELQNFEKIAIINAMLDFCVIEDAIIL